MKRDDWDAFKIILYLILFLLFGIIIICCKSNHRKYIMTVDGPVVPSEMGYTLEHEHVLVDFIGADSTGYFRWDRDEVIEKALPFVLAAKERGVKTFIECTPAYLVRDPHLLKELSERTGMLFLTNTGYYGAHDNAYIPRSFYSIDANELARPYLEPGAPNSTGWYADRIIELKNRGLLHKVLISHDSGWYDPAKPGGGTFNGFTDIFDSLIPELKSRGMTDSDIDQIIVRNPAEAFKIKIHRL